MHSTENRPFEIIEPEDFLSQVQSRLGDLRAWDEIKSFFELFVARDPYLFEAIPGTDWRAVVVLTDPPSTLYFSVNETAEVIVFEALV